MDTLIKVLIGILMFCVIVVSHEFGHFIIAKANGVIVREFFVGFGPILFKKTKGDTTYSLRLIPLGGACVFDYDENTEDPMQSSYLSSNVWVRIAITLAGPVFNFILAFLLSLFVVGGTGYSPTMITEVSKGSPAMKAGLCEGDLITKIDRDRVYLFGEVSFATMYNRGEPIKITFIRDGIKQTLNVTPEYNEEYGRPMLGITFGYNEDNPTPLETIKYSYCYVRYWVKITVKSFLMMFTGQVGVKDLSSPIGVASVVSDVYDSAAKISVMAIIYSMLDIAILISANLGVVNLLPIPGLDGGKLIFYIIELFRGKPVSQERQGAVTLVGFALLLLLTVVVMYNDIIRIIQ